jgi:hypothetical protein
MAIVASRLSLRLRRLRVRNGKKEGIIAYRGPSVQIRDLSSHLKQVEPVVKPVRQNHAHTVARTNGADAPSMLARQLRQVVFRTGAMSGAETVALRRPCAG